MRRLDSRIPGPAIRIQPKKAADPGASPRASLLQRSKTAKDER